MNESERRKYDRSAGWRHVSRRRAFLSHLALSATVVGTVCIAIFELWYPEPYFTVKGAWNVLRVLVGVDLVVGPVLTLILFRPGKPGLGLDVAMIALIQLSALVYGTTVIYQARPYYAVFAVDRFEILARGDVPPGSVIDTALADKPLIGPIFAYATVPSDPARMQRLIEETIFEGKPDIDKRPEFWQSFDENRAAVLARAQPLTVLAEHNPARIAEIEALSASLGEDPSALVYVPVIGNEGPLTMIIDARTAVPRAVLPIDPWDQPTQAVE